MQIFILKSDKQNKNYLHKFLLNFILIFIYFLNHTQYPYPYYFCNFDHFLFMKVAKHIQVYNKAYEKFMNILFVQYLSKSF